MIVEKRRIEDSTLLNVEGVIKLGESAQFFAQALERALEEDDGNVLVDFSRINYIDSTGIGELVGYLTGCPDTALLTSEDERITQAITRHKVMLRARSMPFFLRSMVDLVRAKVRGGGAASGEAVGRWPAHLHINLAPKPAGRVSPMS